MRRGSRPSALGILAWLLLFTGVGAAQENLVSLEARQTKVRSAVARALPATVGIRSATRSGGGSGVVVSADGLVLTAAHVTQATGERVFILFPDGREYPARALGANRSTDAGMIQIEGEGPFPHVQLGTQPAVHDWCLALGHPGGFDPTRPPPVRLGQVLDEGRFLVTDCALTNGDSGGPLFDLEGRLIGIHSSIGASLANNNHVAIERFRADWDRMKAGETWGRLEGARRERGVLGIRIERLRGDHGFRIERVVPGTPAEEAGLEVDDEIVAVGGEPVESFDELRRALLGFPGDRLRLTVRRGERTSSVEVELISREDLDR